MSFLWPTTEPKEVANIKTKESKLYLQELKSQKKEILSPAFAKLQDLV